MKINNFIAYIKSTVSDIRFLLIALLLFAIAIASATFIEKFYGSDSASVAVYHNWAVYLFPAIIFIGFIFTVFDLKLVKRKRWCSILIHSSFIVIFAGAITTHLFGKEGVMHLRVGEKSSTICDSEGNMFNLPYSISLNDFDVEFYNGSEFPSAYKSFVTVNSGDDCFDATIEVNKILRVNGDRVYQLSYDEDMNGSTLLVNSDFAGSFITYTGYVLLLMGFVLALFAKESRLMDILRMLGDKSYKSIAVFILLSLSLSANANDLSFEDECLIPVEDGEKWEHLLVLSNNGIVEPLECHARTILRKLSHSNGEDSERWGARVYMSMITYPEIWCNVPILYCSEKDLVKTLTNSEGKYVSYNDLFDNRGNYKLNISGSSSKEIKKLDEKVRIFSALSNCSLLKIFPDDSGNWFSLENTTYKGKELLFASSAINNYIGKRRDNLAEANEIIDHILAFQLLKSNGNVPSKRKQNLSIVYSKLNVFKVVAFGYIILGVTLLLFALKYINGATFMQQIKTGAVAGAIFAFFLLHLSGIALRWYVSEQPPWSNTYETMVYIALCMVFGGLFFIKKRVLVFALATIVAAVTLFISSLNWLDPVVTPLMPALNSPWLIFHVTVITASYGFFGICAVIGITTLIVSFKSNSKPLVRELSLINEFMMYIGLILVTAGTILGAVWANLSWGRYWGWDAKESWALITIIVYAVVSHLRLVPKWCNDIIFASLSVFAILSVLMTYFGVNYYLSGLHSYGNTESLPAVDVILYAFSGIAILSVAAFVKEKRLK